MIKQKSIFHKSATTFRYTDAVKSLPRRVRLLDGRWVGVGGPIIITPAPPKLPFTCPEITQAQMQELWDAGGLRGLVEIDTAQTAADVSDLPESGT